MLAAALYLILLADGMRIPANPNQRFARSEFRPLEPRNFAKLRCPSCEENEQRTSASRGAGTGEFSQARSQLWIHCRSHLTAGHSALLEGFNTFSLLAEHLIQKVECSGYVRVARLQAFLPDRQSFAKGFFRFSKFLLIP